MKVEEAHLPTYAIPIDVSGGCLLDRWAYPSNNDLLRSMLINEGVSGSLQSYYELVQADDLSACDELLLHRKRLCKLLVRKTYSYGTTRKVGSTKSWPIVFAQYLYNSSTAGICG